MLINRYVKIIAVLGVALIFPRSTQTSSTIKQDIRHKKDIKYKPLTQHDQKPDD